MTPRKLSNATQLRWHSIVHSSSLATLKLILFSISFSHIYSYCGERDEGSRSVELLNVPVSIMPLHKISSFVAELATVKRTRLSQRQFNLLRMGVCMCFIGGVPETRSSIIPDWHQLDSEVFTAQVPQTAGTEGFVTSVLWVIRCLSEKSILSLQSPLPVRWHSQQSLRPLKRKQILKLKRDTFVTCILIS